MKVLTTLAGCAALAMLNLANVAQAQIVYSGTTVGEATFNRPIDNGLSAPTTLSGVGTAVPYQARTFTVSTTGNYDLASISGDPSTFDNYTVLYQGAFDPAAPLTNAVRANDDDNDTVGISGFIGQTLTAGQSYTLVTTGYENVDAGAFDNSIRLQSVFQTGTTVGGPTWDPFGEGEDVSYSALTFTVNVSGLYNFGSVSDGFDNYVLLYEDTFDPTQPGLNLLNENDDSPVVGRSGFLGQQLTAGTTYHFVTTGFDQTEAGAFTNTISGPGTLTPVPAPSGLAVMGLPALIGVGVMLRRRHK